MHDLTQLGTRRRTHRLATVLAALALLTSGVASADTLVSPEYQAPILARVLARDEALATRSGARITFGLLLQEGRASSLNLKTIEAFSGLRSATIGGVGYDVRFRSYRGIDDLFAWVADEGIDVLYLANGLDDALAEIQALCRERQLIAVTGVESFVRKGVPLGVVLRGENARILINTAAAHSAGLNLPQEVLDLAELIR